MPSRLHIATAKAKCYRCGRTIDVGEKMVTTLDRHDIVTTVHAEDCCAHDLPPVVFDLVADALKAAKELR